MKRSEAIHMMHAYGEYVAEHVPSNAHPVLTDLAEMPKRFPEDGSEDKAMRWLGYMQGVLASNGVFTLEELKIHNRDKTVSA